MLISHILRGKTKNGKARKRNSEKLAMMEGESEKMPARTAHFFQLALTRQRIQ
jgi:hypothetical protein